MEDCNEIREGSNTIKHQKVYSVKKPWKCSECGKSFSYYSPEDLSYTRGFIQERSSMYVLNVERPSAGARHLSSIRESTLERKPMSVMNVEKLSVIIQPLFNIISFIPEKSPVSATNVGRHSTKGRTLSNITE